MYRHLLQHGHLSMKIGYVVMYREGAGRVVAATVTGVLGSGPSMNHALTLDATGDAPVPHEADADGGPCWAWNFPATEERVVEIPATMPAAELSEA